VIKWLHKGEEVGSNSSNITLKAVALPNAQRDDSGEYRCEAYLGTKTAFGTVNLKIVYKCFLWFESFKYKLNAFYKKVRIAEY
jgi:hypothetical protein